jgi:DNA recombination protein RmuC
MDRILFIVGGTSVTGLHLLLAAAGLAFVLLLIATVALLRLSGARGREAAATAERQRELDDKMAEIARAGAELSGRMQTVAEVLGSRQADLARVVNDRLDAVGHRVGQGIEQAARQQGESLTKLAERLAVIDAAQANLKGLTQEVVSLKDVLANKQARGAFGQGRMEAIVRDGLPPQAYEFQYSLQSRVRPDCIVRLPGDDRVLVIDAKFPLEGFSALRDAKDDPARHAAMTRVRGDVGKHVRDIAEKYLVPGETQDLAILFVPSEAVYADLCEQFEDVVQKAHRARVIIVSPSLLMMAIQVLQALVRDARVREQAHVIQIEVRNLVDDVTRLSERVKKLDAHFRQASDDIGQITTSTTKILKRGERIDQMDFETPPAGAPKALREAAE